MAEKNILTNKIICFKAILFLLSIGISYLLFFKVFFNILPVYFGNMESLNKNILAFFIMLLAIYILLKMVFNFQSKWDGYLLLFLYFFVLVLGLLRPDGAIYVETMINFNLMSFINDLQMNQISWLKFFINMIIFMPLYFLLTFIPIWNNFIKRWIVFEIIIIIFEALQVFLHVGVFDLADLILYNIGFFIGAGIVIFFQKMLAIYSKKGVNI
ncbi:VanZ family protein [Listeria welshimeri]|uniref:VanZ family protein n=1 Tax=Listeria welshimeri TaxID=1643 RepID=UPI001E3A9D6C|nr:VanZ family protein [Listeria welshimeri]